MNALVWTMPRPADPTDPDYMHQLRLYPCAALVKIVADGGLVSSLEIEGGCDGMRQAIGALAVGRPCVEVAERLRGIRCGNRVTCCPAEIAKALMEV